MTIYCLRYSKMTNDRLLELDRRYRSLLTPSRGSIIETLNLYFTIDESEFIDSFIYYNGINDLTSVEQEMLFRFQYDLSVMYAQLMDELSFIDIGTISSVRLNRPFIYACLK